MHSAFMKHMLFAHTHRLTASEAGFYCQELQMLTGLVPFKIPVTHMHRHTQVVSCRACSHGALTELFHETGLSGPQPATERPEENPYLFFLSTLKSLIIGLGCCGALGLLKPASHLHTHGRFKPTELLGKNPHGLSLLDLQKCS